MVSVIMGVFNGEQFLQEAVDSILGQTFTNFEFLIVDDGSTDNSATIIEGYNDFRIRLIRNHCNLGLAASLNRALSMTRGTYIARMDADDVCLSERLERQVAFLEENPHIGACGTWMRVIGESGGAIFKYPLTAPEIRCRLLFDSALSHPTMMFRRGVFDRLEKVYDPIFSPAEDFDLWSRLSIVTELANIDVVMLLYRQHFDQVTNKHQKEQSLSRREVYKRQLESLGIAVSPEELSLHEMFHDLRFIAMVETLDSGENWLYRLLETNDKARVFDPYALTVECAYRWFRLCDAATDLGWTVWRTFWSSPLAQESSLTGRQRLRFILKCALRWRTQGAGGPWERIGWRSPLHPAKEIDA